MMSFVGAILVAIVVGTMLVEVGLFMLLYSDMLALARSSGFVPEGGFWREKALLVIIVILTTASVYVAIAGDPVDKVVALVVGVFGLMLINLRMMLADSELMCVVDDVSDEFDYT